MPRKSAPTLKGTPGDPGQYSLLFAADNPTYCDVVRFLAAQILAPSLPYWRRGIRRAPSWSVGFVMVTLSRHSSSGSIPVTATVGGHSPLLYMPSRSSDK